MSGNFKANVNVNIRLLTLESGIYLLTMSAAYSTSQLVPGKKMPKRT